MRILRHMAIRRGSSSVHSLFGLCTLLLLLVAGCVTGVFASSGANGQPVADSVVSWTSVSSVPAAGVEGESARLGSQVEPSGEVPDRCSRPGQIPEPAQLPSAGQDTAPVTVPLVAYEITPVPTAVVEPSRGCDRAYSSVELSQLSMLRV